MRKAVLIDACGRLPSDITNIEIRVGNERAMLGRPPSSTGNAVCKYFASPPGAPIQAVCDPPLTGRYVTIERRNAGTTYLILCEVEVSMEMTCFLLKSASNVAHQVTFVSLCIAPLGHISFFKNMCGIACVSKLYWTYCYLASTNHLMLCSLPQVYGNSRPLPPAPAPPADGMFNLARGRPVVVGGTYDHTYRPELVSWLGTVVPGLIF